MHWPASKRLARSRLSIGSRPTSCPNLDAMVRNLTRTQGLAIGLGTRLKGSGFCFVQSSVNHVAIDMHVPKESSIV